MLVVSPVFLAALLLPTAVLGATLVQPPKVSCSGNGTLDLYVVKSAVSVDSGASFTTRAYSLDGTTPLFPGPTVVMTPGTPCVVNLRNVLPDSFGGKKCHSETGHFNGMGCPDTTNLHTHGLHVSPAEDDVTAFVEPGESRVYAYNVNAEHVAGTNWFHAHAHGSTALQVAGGLAGTLLMARAPSSDPFPADIASLYGADATNGTVVVLQHMYFSGGENNDRSFSIPDAVQLQAMFGSGGVGGPAAFPFSPALGAMPSDTFIVNGQYQPTLEIVAGEVRLLRFVHAGGTRMLSLELEGDGSAGCEMRLLARDGVFQETPYPAVSAVATFPGTRADIALRCSTASSSIVFAARGSAYAAAFGSEVQLTHVQNVVMRVAVAASQQGAQAAAMPASAVKRPAYLDDLRSAEVSQVDGDDAGELDLEAEGGDFQINNEAFAGHGEGEYLFDLCVNNTYEFEGDGGERRRRRLAAAAAAAASVGSKNNVEIRGSGPGAGDVAVMQQGRGTFGLHPIHIHVDHMQITAVQGLQSTSADVVRVGEWRDVFAAPEGFTFRMKMNEYEGEAVVHCHLVYHEDMGMMGLINRRQCDGSPAPAMLAYSRSLVVALSALVLAVLL